MLLARGATANAVGSVTVSPAVVPVPVSAAQKTAVLVTASVSGLAAGTTSSCTGVLSRQPSGTVIINLGPVNTSPASASGTASVTLQGLIPGGTPAGAAQAAVTCGAASMTAPFRTTTVAALNVTPAAVPAGGVVTFTAMIAAGGALASTPCSLTITDPSGVVPPLFVQSLAVSGGTATTPASSSVNVTLPASAPVGGANASLSCVVSGAGTFGDSADFTIVPPNTVTVTDVSTPAIAGNPINVTSVTLPGYSCIATIVPPAGAQIDSPISVAGATGTVVNTIALPLTMPAGTSSLTVSCNDPMNAANVATSVAQSVVVVNVAVPPPGAPGAVESVTVTPSAVPVLANAAQNTAALVTASVSGLAAGTTASCTGVLTRQPSGTVIVNLGPVSTSPAPASGVASVTFQALIPGATPAGAAQASVTCGASSMTAAFRTTSVAALTVTPASVSPGGVATFTAIIAAGGVLASTPCSLTITDPSGAAPSLFTQPLTVSGGTATTPASASVNVTLPASAPVGGANGSLSCVVPGAGTFGDSVDFAIVPPNTVTITGVSTPATSGNPINVTSITLPGYSCIATLVPPAGAQIDSPIAIAGATGTVVNTISLPQTMPAGTSSLTVFCNDPTNAANVAMSVAQSVVVLSAATTPPAASCAGVPAPVGSTATAPVANAGSSYSGTEGVLLQFSGAGSLPSAGAVLTTCVWTFGDGGRATMLSPTHIYAAPGTFAVTLTVSDSTGKSATATANAVIVPQLPLCSQPAVTGTTAPLPCTGTLTCPTTSLPGQCLAPCATLVLDANLCPQPYRAAKVATGGPYSGTVSQLVTFQGLASMVGTRRVCSADATLGTGGPFCNLVPATDLPTPVTFSWDLGDGTRANGNPTTHAYGQQGNYVVILTVTFDDGSTATGTTTAQIASPPQSGDGAGS
jgi:PKD repeat protein